MTDNRERKGLSRKAKRIVVGVAATGLVALGISAMPSAHAEAGRRLCYYTENQGGWTQFGPSGDRKYHAYVAVDYKKGAECPVVDTGKFKWQVGAQPVKSIRCEDWPARANPWPGEDVCTNLPANGVFEARVYDDGKGVGASLGADISAFQ